MGAASIVRVVFALVVVVACMASQATPKDPHGLQPTDSTVHRWIEEAFSRIAFKSKSSSAAAKPSAVGDQPNGRQVGATPARKVKDITCPQGRGECDIQWTV